MSPRKPKHPKEHTLEQFEKASDYFEHHLRMYVDTYVWLQQIITNIREKDLISNAMADAHVVHMRAIAQFLSKKDSNYETDVLAVDYFFDNPEDYEPLEDEFLAEWARNVGSWIVHITTVPMPTLVSEMAYPFPKIFRRLLRAVFEFLEIVPTGRFPEKHREACLNHLQRIRYLPPDKGSPVVW
jgi:hypothetical protein